MNARTIKLQVVSAALTLILCSLALAGPASAARGPGIVGSWVVNGQPDGPAPAFINLTTNGADGTVTNTDPLLGTGHGVWRRGTNGSFTVRFVTVTSPFNPIFPNTVITVTGEIKVDKKNDVAEGTFQTTFEDLNGVTLMPMSTGTVQFSRIAID